MTDFEKVRNYYKVFDEQNRLTNSNSGRLEFEMTMKVLEKFLPAKGAVLDLGGGAGAYSFPLAAKGYEVYLADLSDELIKNGFGLKKLTSYAHRCGGSTEFKNEEGFCSVIELPVRNEKETD